MHHVIVRGIEKREIFRDDRDRGAYLERLGERVLDGNARCYAWALMGNHVHLVLRTGNESISRLMHRVGTSYATRFNKRYERAGYLFQNRFRSRVVSSDSYLIAAVRYVLRNPLEAGVVGSLRELEAYDWASYGVLLGMRPPGFEAVAEVLRFFADDPDDARTQLRQLMAAEGEAVPSAPLPAWSPPPEPRQLERRVGNERPPGDPEQELRRLADAACRSLGISLEQLRSRRRDRATSKARAVIARAAMEHPGLSATAAARFMGVSPQAACRAAQRASRELLRDLLGASEGRERNKFRS